MLSFFDKYQATGNVARLLILLMLVQAFHPALAGLKDDCSAKLRQAENEFHTTRFDRAIRLSRECLLLDLDDEQKVKANEVLAMSLLKKGDPSLIPEATTAIRAILDDDSDYTPPNYADEDYKKRVQEIKDEPCPFPCTWHIIAGSAVVAGGIIFLIVNSGDDRTELPPPPGRPTPP